MSDNSIEGIFQFMNSRGKSVQNQIRQDEYANITVSQSLPPYVDLVTNNKVFTANTGTGLKKAFTNTPSMEATPLTLSKT